MARVKEIRASVIAACTEARPTADFPIPDRMVDYIIFSTAGDIIERTRRGAIRVEPWMLTRFDCLEVSQMQSECLGGCDCCETRFFIDLPFQVMELEDDQGISNVFLSPMMVPLRPIQPGLLSMQEFADYPPSYKSPAYTRIGNRLYLMGGDRDFSACKLLIDAAVSAIDDYSRCDDESIVVPVKPGYRMTLIEMATEKCLKMLSQGIGDMTEDGNLTKRGNVG